MSALAPSSILDLCDQGMRSSPLERALLVIATASDERFDEAFDPARWPLGKAHQELLEIRAASFGDNLQLLADCPGCNTVCESEIRCSNIASAGAVGTTSTNIELSGEIVSLQLPTCGDVIAAARSKDPPARALASRLLGNEVATLDDANLGKLASAVAKADPLASIEISLSCPQCKERWLEPLHVVDILWTELKARADRLILDVARLARAFGWRESDILAMTPVRRQHYLDLLPT